MENFKFIFFALISGFFLIASPVSAQEIAETSIASNPETEITEILIESTSTLEIIMPPVEETTDISTSTTPNATSTLDIIVPEMELATTTATSTFPSIDSATFSVNLNIRYQNFLIFSGAVTTSPKETLMDSAGSSHVISASSTVLSALIDAASATSTFTVSQLDYYDTYKSFYLNCLTLNLATSTQTCGNWNYVVNSVYPAVGMDSYEIFGGETIYLYFNNPWQITASTSTFPAGTTTTLNTWRYNFDNLAEEWTPDGDDLIDLSITNPNSLGWWDTTITTTTLTSNPTGFVDYVFSSTGTYFAKIASADYSKWSPAITLTVLDAPIIASSSATSTLENNDSDQDNNNGQGAGVNTESNTSSIISSSDIAAKIGQILNFLKTQQSADGKIIDGGLTDWAIISFAANGEYAEDIKKGDKSLLDFARVYDFSDASDLNICASYPRHVLALLSGGVASSDDQIKSLITKIKSQGCYQNHQFGQNGINDDVFALLSLLAVNNDISDSIIVGIIESIIEDQTVDGAFTWAGYPSADITGAAINALKYASKKGADIDPGVFVRAKNYLKNQQLSDGGWGLGQSDVVTTAWTMMGLNALTEGQSGWFASTNKNPWSVLMDQLNDLGFYESVWAPGTIDWFAEKHAVPALLGKSWPIFLTPREKKVEIVPQNNLLANGGVVSGMEPEISTSTLLNASSTLPLILETNSSTLLLATSSVFIPPLIETSLEEFQLKGDITKISNFSRLKTAKKATKISRETPKEAVFTQPQVLSNQSNDPLLPLEKKVAETAAAGSAVVLSASTLLILSRLLLAVL